MKDYESILKKLRDSGIKYETDVSAAGLTTFKAGGNVAVLAHPSDAAGLLLCAMIARGADSFILGNGSNVLVSDDGFDGIIISTAALDRIEIFGDIVTAGAGARLSALVSAAVSEGLCGLEFAAGIPGSVGGGVFMNAGAYGGEINDCIISADIIDGAAVRTIAAGDMQLSYRHSIFMEKPYIITRASIKLAKGDAEAARARIKELAARRRDKQPLEYPSAGSTFKRPAGNYAGTLIESAGLKGFSIGGAAVSEKHAGFVINTGGATASDIIAVIAHVRQTVLEKSGILLEPEVRIIGGGVRI